MNSKNSIIKQISKETGHSPEIVRACIKWFFRGLRKIMLKNGNINIKGLFNLKLKTHYQKKVNNDPTINLQKRAFPTKKAK